MVRKWRSCVWILAGWTLAASFATPALHAQNAGQGQAPENTVRHKAWLAVSEAWRVHRLDANESLHEDDLRFMAMPASIRSESFEVTRVARDTVQGCLRFRLRCPEPGDCLPFWVWAPSSGHVVSARSALNTAAASRSTGAPTQPSVVWPGQKVRLVTVVGGVRLSQPATCLGRGGLGEEVRVRSRFRGRIWRALVLAPGLVESRGDQEGR